MTIGLFGTCGGSIWRDSFMKRYQENDVEYYNPQVDEWKPEDAVIEAEHLINDEIILFPVTNETYGTGSLSEVGFSILQAIKADTNRNVIIMIDQNLDVLDDIPMSMNEMIQHELLKKESLRARALVKAHLKKLKYPNVYIVKNLEDMFLLSMELSAIETIRTGLEKYRIK